MPRRHWRTLRIIGMPESLADQKLKAFYEKYRDTPVTILASRGELSLHFYALGSEDEAYAKLLVMEADFGPWLQTLGLPRRHWRTLSGSATRSERGRRTPS